MSTSSSVAATCARIPSRRGKRASGGSKRSKPNSSRYLYDDADNTCEHKDDNNISTLSLEDESMVGAGDSFSSLGGFAMAPCEDEKSELTCKVHNLSSVKYGRKFPKHHSGYHNRQQYEYQQYCKQAWQERKRVRFQEDNTNHDDESAIPIGSLTKDAIISMMHAHDSMTFGNNARSALDDYCYDDGGSDAEYPTNASVGSETRSTAVSSAFDDEEVLEQTRLTTSDCREDYDDDDDNILDNEPVSIGITTLRTKRQLLMKRCLPSISTMSRVFFFLGCVLTLWIAIDSLTWAKQQGKNKHNVLRGLSSSTKTVVGKEVSHQDQWNDNSQWDQLQKYQQEAWSELGYTQEGWDSDNQDEVSTEKIDWDKLTEDQKDAAEELGFTQSIWDHFNTNQSTDTSSRVTDQQQKQQVANTAAATEASANQSPNEATSTTSTTSPSTSTISTMTISFREKDPIIFTTGSGDIPITKHMILSFTAALCFTIVGIMEWIQNDLLFQLLLAISGVWGLLSSMFVNRNPSSSVAFHTLSVHCFFGASVAILWLRCRQPSMPAQSRSVRVANRTQEEVLLLADLCFAVGSAMMVVSSYLTISYGADEAALLIDIQRFDVFAAILWVGCSLIYACCAYRASAQEVP